jgi:hypothetical protein
MSNESADRTGAGCDHCRIFRLAMLLATAAAFDSASLHAQAVPAMAPTHLGVQQRTTTDSPQPLLKPVTQPIPLSTTTSQTSHARHQPVLTVSGADIEIQADNSSLNGILRLLSQQTGLTITGGVIDQRVFGIYGPGPAAEVLTQLLQDTGTNMILRQTPEGGLAELILSPRLGGPTPPSPSSSREDADDAQMSTRAPQPAVAQPPVPQQPRVPPLPFPRPAMPAAASDPMQRSVTPDPQGIAEPPLAAPATAPGTTPGSTTQSTGPSDAASGRTNPGSQNGVKTPQQIYEELQQLKQQQDQQPQH